ncbi:cache domain-containing protein [Candidatus Sumerlaeota bacterium]|nr:cache domain-containing protein [Candidatus Sumerlaeota bacterium]
MFGKIKSTIIGGESIRLHLLRNFIIAILIPSLIICLVGIRIISYHVLRQAQEHVVADLKMAREIYNSQLNQLTGRLRLLSECPAFIEDVLSRDHKAIQGKLSASLREEGLDTLTLIDPQGRVVARGSNPSFSGDMVLKDPFVARALKEKRPISATQIVGEEELRKEGLYERAKMNIIPTPRAKIKKGGVLTSGMMLKSAVPLFNAKEEFLGVLVGGILLNRNFSIVDKIKETVFESKVGGTATIFQDDVRIATNVLHKDGTRAIGTRVSQEVYEAVVEQGKKWIAEAFVVNDWYITAYEPIYDLQKKIIGILYVGILKRPYTLLLWKTILIFLGTALLGILIVVYVSIRAAHYISDPLMKIAKVARKISNGDYQQRAEIDREDEIGYLAKTLNQMTDKLLSAQESLKNWNKELEQKVKEATEEVKRMERQLCQSEKLASLGKLAAGVAHEINNPLTGVLTIASLMLEDLPEDDPRREDVETIVRETMRCRKIVRGLLDFARQSPPERKPANINQIIENTLQLLQNQIAINNIQVQKELASGLPDIWVDVDQIQQVLVNITLNAIEAMSAKGGELTIRSYLFQDGFIAIDITDTGVGIAMEDIKHLFDPFYTTKQSGTGLGLAISYGIVQRHGGRIKVHSHFGKGTTFTVILPIDLTDGQQDESNERQS